MANRSVDPRKLAQYAALAQVGFEMVTPIGLGVALDLYFRWGAWGSVTGAILGLVGGFAHLVAILNRVNEKPTEDERQDNQ